MLVSCCPYSKAGGLSASAVTAGYPVVTQHIPSRICLPGTECADRAQRGGVPAIDAALTSKVGPPKLLDI
jgi:hypothetical protein